MTIDLSPLANVQRVLFEIPLVPLQGQRFQPTGFPNLGAATFQSSDGQCLLVESAQSMANRLELKVWDEDKQDVKEDLKGISHVRVERNGKFLTDTILESHRLNSPYLLEESSKAFFNKLKEDLGGLETGPIDRKKLAEILLKYDIGSLLHGVFLAKPGLAGGRLRVARALSAFIEANVVRVAASGGVKNDYVNPSWPKEEVAKGFGNVPFARDEFTAESITLYVNLDLAQVRGYGLGTDVERLLTLLAFYKLRALLDNSLRLRTACDLRVDPEAKKPFVAKSPSDFSLPDDKGLTDDLKQAIEACKDKMPGDIATFNDELKKRKEGDDSKGADDNDGSTTDDNAS
jgi:CRISPR-associated protein Csb1